MRMWLLMWMWVCVYVYVDVDVYVYVYKKRILLRHPSPTFHPTPLRCHHIAPHIACILPEAEALPEAPKGVPVGFGMDGCPRRVPGVSWRRQIGVSVRFELRLDRTKIRPGGDLP